MTLTELKYIVAVAREKHFGRAAEACFVSQPTLSVAIKKLEEELDVKLFERGASEVSVTPLGEQIVRQAQQVIEQAAAIKEIAKRGKDPVSGPLRLGIIYTIGPYLLPDLVRQAIARVPQMPLMLQENFTAGCWTCCAPANSTAPSWPSPSPTPGLAVAPLYDEPFLAAVPTAHPFAKRKRISAEELKNETMLLLGTGHCFRDHVLEVCPEYARFASSESDTREGIRKSFEGSSAWRPSSTWWPRAWASRSCRSSRVPKPSKQAHIRYVKFAATPCPRAAWCWPGAAPSRATRPSRRCATASMPAPCRA